MKRAPKPDVLLPIIIEVIAKPDHPDTQSLITVLSNRDTATIVADCAPPGTLAQVSAAMSAGLPYLTGGWEQHTESLLHIITDHRWASDYRLARDRMIAIWSYLPGAVGALRRWEDDLITWAKHRLSFQRRPDLAILLGSSTDAARLSLDFDGSRTYRYWSMATDPHTPTAWQASITPDVRSSLFKNADTSRVFPAFGWDYDTGSEPYIIMRVLFRDLTIGWPVDHPSIRGRARWLECRNYISDGNDDEDIVYMAAIASLGLSNVLAEKVRDLVAKWPRGARHITEFIPQDRLHPRIREQINVTSWTPDHENVYIQLLWDPTMSPTRRQRMSYDFLCNDSSKGARTIRQLIEYISPGWLYNTEPVFHKQRSRSKGNRR